MITKKKNVLIVKQIYLTSSKGNGIIIHFWETAHLPLPYANINTYFSLRANYWLRGGVGGQFPKIVYNDWSMKCIENSAENTGMWILG